MNRRKCWGGRKARECLNKPVQKIFFEKMRHRQCSEKRKTTVFPEANFSTGKKRRQEKNLDSSFFISDDLRSNQQGFVAKKVYSTQAVGVQNFVDLTLIMPQREFLLEKFAKDID